MSNTVFPYYSISRILVLDILLHSQIGTEIKEEKSNRGNFFHKSYPV